MLVIVGEATADTVPFGEIVYIGFIERVFLGRTNGFVDVGTNVARANRLASILVKGRFNHRGPRWGFDANGKSYWQRQESVSETGDTTASISAYSE